MSMVAHNVCAKINKVCAFMIVAISLAIFFAIVAASTNQACELNHGKKTIVIAL